VVASHYAKPVERKASKPSPLLQEPSSGEASIRDLAAGEAFQMLDDTLGWAWGYAANDGRVGYVRSDALGR